MWQATIGQISNLVLRILRPNLLALLSIIAGISLFMFTGWIYNFQIDFSIYSGDALYIVGLSSALLVLLAASLISLFKSRPARPTAFLKAKFVHDWNVTSRVLQGIPIFLIELPFFSAFTSYKASFTKIVPFYADPYAIAADHAIHGTEPWRLLQPILGFPIVTETLNVFYNLWFFVMFIVLSLAIFMTDNPRLRSQYLVAFTFSWVFVGGLLATLFSSVGPCFYLSFYKDETYRDLFAYLDHVNTIYPLWARSLQVIIVEKFQKGELGIGEGISAMPSMHVTIVVLNAIFISKLNRIAGWVAWIFAALIFIGSVHLGWHYAIDGYVSAILVTVIWFISGKLADKFAPYERVTGGEGGI